MTLTDRRSTPPLTSVELPDARPDLDAVLRPHVVNARSALMNALSVTREELDRDSGQKIIGKALAFMTQEIAILSGQLQEIVATGDRNTP